MNLRFKAIQSIVALGVVAGCRIASDDSLVTTTGTTLIGVISRTTTGYSVQTAAGPVEVPIGDVKRILRDNTAGPARLRTHVDPAEVNSLVGLGKNAMAAGAFNDARDLFTDALSLDHSNAIAARGLGFAYLKLSNPQRAADAFGKAAAKPPVDRTMTLALASAVLSRNNPMRRH